MASLGLPAVLSCDPRSVTREPSCEIVDRRGRSSARQIGMPKSRNTGKSGAEPLPALRAAACNNPAATFGGHAGAKTVAALAHEFAWLIGPLHESSPLIAGSASDSVTATEPKWAWRHGTCRRFRVPGPTPEFTRLIREPPRPVNAMRTAPLRLVGQPVLVPWL